MFKFWIPSESGFIGALIWGIIIAGLYAVLFAIMAYYDIKLG